MGFIRDFFNRIMKRRETKLLETATQEEIKKFIDEIHRSNDERTKKTYETFDSRKPTREHYERAAVAINNFISLINDGKVDIGGNPSDNVYKRLLNYFKGDSVIYSATMDLINREFYDRIDKASNGETYEQVHSALDKTLEEYFRIVGSDKRIDRLFEIGKVKEIREILNKSVLLLDDTMEAIDLGNKVAEIYEGTLLYRIRKEKDVSTQIALYEEYIRDFRDGKEIDLEKEKDYLRANVEDICQMDFIKVRELRKRCEEYGIPPVAKVSKIYKTETFKTTRDRNDLLCDKHIEAGKVETSDLALVRTTEMFPRHGIIETTDKHSDLLVEESPFARELKESGVIDLDKYNIVKFQNRRTIHFTLNGLVGSHEYGNFQNRNFIIIEPFDEHVNDDSLMNINEADTYFEDNMVLSKRASILIPVERYKELIKDEKMLRELNKFDIRLFDGNEEEAVRMCLLDKGYTFGEIHKWGFENFSEKHTSRAKNEDLIELQEEAIAEKLQAKGKNVEYAGVHFHSESKEIDDERRKELLTEELKLFVECVAEAADFEFSKTALMNELLSREYLPKEAQFEEGDKDKPELEVKVLLEKLTPEGLEKATKKYNEVITEQHKQARKAKDEELKQKGLIVEETKIETKEDRDGK